MTIDYFTLKAHQKNNPAWLLIRSPHAPLIVSFVYKAFVVSNDRARSQADLAEALEDELYVLRNETDAEAFSKSATEYLTDWADKGWLRKSYDKNDEAQFEPTAAIEKVIAWTESLTDHSFVGTESRLRTLFELLQQISTGSETDPKIRIAELQKRQKAIEAEIEQIQTGNLPLLDDTALKDRFLQFRQIARDLLSDFRQVEHNFRELDRRVRERITLWEGSKGELLEDIMGEHTTITDSDQGKNFQAFWDFLMSPKHQEDFTQMLDKVLSLAAILELKPDPRTRRIHYDWLSAGEHTQRTVAQLSQQLRRFLDDQAWLENRRIMDILHGIETKALKLRDTDEVALPKQFMQLDALAADIELPLEHPLYSPPIKPEISSVELKSGTEQIDTQALFSQTYIDKLALAERIHRVLQQQSQITLGELCQIHPLQQGLAELVGYLELAAENKTGYPFKSVVDDSVKESIRWEISEPPPENLETPPRALQKQTRVPRIIYLR